MEEIAERVYNVGLAELALDEAHNMWQIGFTLVRTVEYLLSHVVVVKEDKRREGEETGTRDGSPL
jgi:exonuclease VII small subunit